MKTTVLVDCQNIYHDCRSFGKKIDFLKLKQLLNRQYGTDIFTKIYLVADQNTNTDRFESMLKNLGFDFNIKRASRRSKSKATNHDVNIIMDALDGLSGSDRLVMLSGDGDFTDLLRRYKDQGKLTEVWAFKESFSKLLVQVVDSIRFLNNEDIFRDVSDDKEREGQCVLSETLSDCSGVESTESSKNPLRSIYPDDQQIVPTTRESL